jgi:hypothetical protein
MDALQPRVPNSPAHRPSPPKRSPRPGSIPPHQRRLAVIVCVVTIVLMVTGCLLVNLLAGSPVDWFWLVAGTAFVAALIAFFLWVRLSD